MSKYSVGVYRQQAVGYPMHAPFHPPRRYEELDFVQETDETNGVYDAVRSSFRLMGYDAEHYGTKQWNPLGWLVSPGETVLLKPNMLAHKHFLNDDWDYVITHGSVIRAVVDYVYRALKGKGRIIIADGPQSDSIIERILEELGILEMQEYYRKTLAFDLEFIDLRDMYRIEKEGVLVGTKKLKGDPAGSVVFDLASQSMFAELGTNGIPYYGCDYDIAETQSHHSNGKHEYCICRTPLLADVFINIPKLKTHKKCALTVNLKSLVGGVNANKNYLPHYIIGAPANGGDQFDRASAKTKAENTVVIAAKKLLQSENRLVQFLAMKLKQPAYRVFGSTSEVVRSGNWYGNDTVWRMCLDLNRILLYGTSDGVLDPGRKKKFLSIVDGIHAMEGNGPNAGTSKEAGVIVIGDNPVSVDAACAGIMGFDHKRIKLIERSFEHHELPLIRGTYDDIGIVSNLPEWSKLLRDWTVNNSLRFMPHFGWKGHIELEDLPQNAPALQ